MIFVYALIPISCIATVLSFGGATSPFALFLPLILLPIFREIKGVSYFLLTICLISVAFRFLSLFVRVREALGDWGAIVFVMLCLAVSIYFALKGESVFYASVPIFFVTALMAIYVLFVSFGKPPSEAFGTPNFMEIISAVACPIGSVYAFSCFSADEPKKCLKAYIFGVSVASIFLLFPIAKAELGFLCVPLSITVSGVEIKALKTVILQRKAE